MAKNGGLIRFVGATAAGAIIGALAIRAFDKHILSKGEKGDPQALPPAQPGMHPGMAQVGAAPLMPVFLPSPFMGAPMMGAPMMGPPMSVPPPPTLGPAQVPKEEIDVLDEIERDWEAD